MITAVTFIAAAAAGAIARAEAGRRWNSHDGFPWGTLTVNVTVHARAALRDHAADRHRLGVAGLGVYTTFSSFARDAVALAEMNQVMRVAIYVALSCFLGITAAAAGVAIA